MEERNSINESLQKRARANRLPSLQPARDLSLGGITKRTFIPNLNAKKVKEEPEPQKSEKAKKEQGQSSKRRREPRPQKERKQRGFIQTYSIFAEGPAAASNLGRNEKPGFNFPGSGAKGEKGQGLRLGGLKSASSGVKKEEGGQSPKKEKKRIEGFISDIEEGDTIPVVYPRKPATSHRMTTSELFLKEAENLEYEELGLIQLVNPIPVEPTSVGLDHSKEGNDSVDFTRLPEGEFGKLQVLDNGEVRLVMGDKNAAVKVLQGTQVDHLMELVRIRTIEEDENPGDDDDISIKTRTGEMHVLGQIENRFVCTVDFDSVFQEMSLEQETTDNDSDSDFDDR